MVICLKIQKVSKILNENNYSYELCFNIKNILAKSKRLLSILEQYNENKNLDEIIANINLYILEGNRKYKNSSKFMEIK